ncbi:MAG: helix-turn-helix domain-containing protein [Alphaproteobacteria bacterium]|nr:helix-turn-helix domain-containing protein [Alphaproteobacteria bacterium]
MLNGVRVYTSDRIWRQILADFGATVLDAPTITCLNFDTLELSDIVSPMQLKSLILSATDNTNIITQIFGRRVSLSALQTQIIALLHKAGGLSYQDLRTAMGFAPDVATHTIDTAIYQLRQKYGRDIIQNINGVYRLGKL